MRAMRCQRRGNCGSPPTSSRSTPTDDSSSRTPATAWTPRPLASLRAVLHDEGGRDGAAARAPTVYGIVEQAGGTITLASRQGEGTRFHVLLPVAQRGPDARLAPTAARRRGIRAHPPRRGRAQRPRDRDDDPHVNGYAVVASHDPIDALESPAQETFAPDLIVSDLMMPRLSGVELAERADLLRPGIRFLSFRLQRPQDAREGQPSPENAAEKPFTAGELTQALCAEHSIFRALTATVGC